MGGKRLLMNDQTKKYYVAYRSQMYNAGARGIEWHFTFDQWLEWWGDDIDKRGRGKDSLVMARTGDVGPYHPDNVRKATKAENVKEGCCKTVITSLGQFESALEAANAHNVTLDILRYRLKRHSAEYYYAK